VQFSVATNERFTVAPNIVYLVCKHKKKRPKPTSAIGGLPVPRVNELPRRDPVRLALMPVTNGRGRVDGVGLQLRFRF